MRVYSKLTANIALRGQTVIKSTSIYTMALCTMLISTAAYAEPSTAPGVVDRELATPSIPKSFSLDADAKAPLQPAPEVAQADNVAVVATLSAVQFSGLDVVSETDLQAIAAPYIGRGVTAHDLAKLKYEVTSHYYESGFVLVKVVSPEQDLANGVLELDVYEAKVGDIAIESDGLLRDFVANAFASRLAKGEVFDETDVESMISDLNNLNGFGATLNLKKGAAFGQTDLTAHLYASDDDENYVRVDNYGSPLTGQVVATGHLEISNLAKLGEKIYTTVRRSDGDLWSVALGGYTPIGIKNIKLHLDYLHSENEIGDRLASQAISGETDLFSVSLSSDIINVTKERLTLQTGVEARKHQSFSELTGVKVTSSEDDVRQGFVSATYVMRESDWVFYKNVRLVKGLSTLGADDAGVGRSDPNAAPDAWRLQSTVLANALSPISDGTFNAVATGQLASDRLLSSDLFTIGGYGSVRGFDPAQETGESGYSFSAEYAHNMPDLGEFGVKFGPWLDGGAVYNRGAAGAVDSHLYSMGLGAELEGDIVSTGTTVIRMDWAKPLGSYTSNLVDGNQFFFRVTQKF
jgi:hemolysin activation/secretion protein